MQMPSQNLEQNAILSLIAVYVVYILYILSSFLHGMMGNNIYVA